MEYFYNKISVLIKIIKKKPITLITKLKNITKLLEIDIGVKVETKLSAVKLLKSVKVTLYN